MQFLISQGVEAGYGLSAGLGDAQPVGSNNTPQGRARIAELNWGLPILTATRTKTLPYGCFG